MSDANPPVAELGITAEDMSVESTAEGIERLFGQSFEVRRLENGKPIPVGGSNRFTDVLDREVVGDFDHFEPLLQEMHADITTQDTPGLKQWLEAQQLPIDSKLLAILTAFTRKLTKRYPITPENVTARRDMYAESEKGKAVKLSDVFEGQSPECAEIAALAQYFLQDEGVKSSYFSGEVLWDIGDEFGEKHSFIVIEDKDRQYIFDPANPTKTQGGMYPSLYTVKADFDTEVRKGQKRYVAGTNILTRREAFYGVGNGTNVLPTNIVAQ